MSNKDIRIESPKEVGYIAITVTNDGLSRTEAVDSPTSLEVIREVIKRLDTQ